MATKLEQLEKLGIIDDLMENNTIEQLSTMSAKSILGEWLEWEGIQGYTNKIVNIYETLRPKCAQEVIKELYEQNNIDGSWSVHLDDLSKEEFPFEVEDWMYVYAMSLQPKLQTDDLKMEYEIGAELKYLGKKLVIVEEEAKNACEACELIGYGKCHEVKCTVTERSDNKQIIFTLCNE